MRFRHWEDMPVKEWLPVVAGTVAERSQELLMDEAATMAGASSPASSGRRAPLPSDAPGLAQRFGGLAQQRRDEDVRHEVSVVLEDCVGACNLASRNGHGDVVWLSWCGGPTGPCKKKSYRSTHVHNGSTLLAFTRRGVELLRDRMRQKDPGHIDLVIKEILLTDPELNACSSYCLPSMGGFSEQHISMNMGGEVRHAPWIQNWCPGGTNPLNCQPGRSCSRALVRFVSGGVPPEIVELDLPARDRKYLWRTLAPPAGPREDETMAEMCARRGWWSPRGWQGPFFQTVPRWWHESPQKGKGKGRGGKGKRGRVWQPVAQVDRAEQLRSLPPGDYWRSLQEDPFGRVCINGVTKPISRLAYELACSEMDPPAPGAPQVTEKAQRELRGARAAYLERYFWTGPEEEAVAGKKRAGGGQWGQMCHCATGAYSPVSRGSHGSS